MDGLGCHVLCSGRMGILSWFLSGLPEDGSEAFPFKPLSQINTRNTTTTITATITAVNTMIISTTPRSSLGKDVHLPEGTPCPHNSRPPAGWSPCEGRLSCLRTQICTVLALPTWSLRPTSSWILFPTNFHGLLSCPFCSSIPLGNYVLSYGGRWGNLLFRT